MIVGHPTSGKIGYELTLQPLEEKFTMVYFDSRGTGKSEAPQYLENYGYEFLVEEIEHLRKHLNINEIWLFAHSDQSSIALQYAIDYPKNISGLILTGTSFVENSKIKEEKVKSFEKYRIEQSNWFREVINDWDYLHQNDYKVTKNKEGKDLTYTKLKWWCYNEETSQKVIPIYDEISKAGRQKEPQIAATKQQQEINRNKIFERLYQYEKKYFLINTKILILNGKFDTNNPPELAKNLNKNLKNSTLIFVDEAGHFPWVEQPEKSFSEIFEWLKK